MKSTKLVFTILLVSIFAILTSVSNSTSNSFLFDDYEEMRCKRMLKSFDTSMSELPMSELVVEVGKKFLGTEYVGGTLDKNTRNESLVIMITGLDCVTFVENALIMARLIKSGKLDFDSYKEELTKIRYREGVINGYPSRLHYFTDWIFDNQEKGIVTDITESIGGVPYNKNINFMTSNVGSYKQLENNSSNIAQMKEVENMINSRTMFYIPKQEVNLYYDKLKSGDIIATTTDIGGLDVTHTGFVYKENGKTYFLHASVQTKDVMITNVELREYLMSNKRQSGIIVARPNELD